MRSSCGKTPAICARFYCTREHIRAYPSSNTVTDGQSDKQRFSHGIYPTVISSQVLYTHTTPDAHILCISVVLYIYTGIVQFLMHHWTPIRNNSTIVKLCYNTLQTALHSNFVCGWFYVSVCRPINYLLPIDQLPPSRLPYSYSCTATTNANLHEARTLALVFRFDWIGLVSCHELRREAHMCASSWHTEHVQWIKCPERIINGEQKKNAHNVMAGQSGLMRVRHWPYDKYTCEHDSRAFYR